MTASRRRFLQAAITSTAATPLSAAAGPVAPTPSGGQPDGAALPFAMRPGTLADLHHDRDPLVITAILPASPQRVFDVLAAPEPWPRWLSVVKDVRYRTDARGVGCERDVTTSGDVIIREHFLAWDRGERFAFFVTSSTSEAMAFFMEDYRLLPVAGGQTRLRWTVGVELAGAAAVVAPIFRAVFRAAATDGLTRLATMLRRGDV